MDIKYVILIYMEPEAQTEADQYGIVVQSLQRIGVLVVQVISWPFLLTLRLLVVRNHLHREITSFELSKNSPESSYILFSNHQSIIDPFIISASLPSRIIKQLIPFRFFVANGYFKGPKKVFLNIMGGFRAYPDGNKAYGLNRARALLATSQTVVIFPPGTRTRKRIVKQGISVLATEPNTYLIPIHIDWKSRWSCTVHIGKLIKGDKTYSAEELMEIVYNLPNKVSK
jgi:1-acyl-sn-glycerol-3-phosphate acyltransferase